MDIDAGKLR
jgi:hypothetical protein